MPFSSVNIWSCRTCDMKHLLSKFELHLHEAQFIIAHQALASDSCDIMINMVLRKCHYVIQEIKSWWHNY